MKELQELKKISEKMRKGATEERTLKEKYWSKEIQYSEFHEAMEKMRKEQEIKSIQYAISKDNLLSKINEIVNDAIIPEVKKYANKNIGCKTIQKISDKITEILKAAGLENVKARVYLSYASRWNELHVYFLDDTGCTDYHMPSFKIYLYAEEYGRFETIADVKNIEIVEDPRKKAKELIKEKKAIDLKVEKLEKEIESLRKNYKEKLTDELSEKLKFQKIELY